MRLTVPPELIQAARIGEADSMERLLQALWPHAYRIARSIVHDDTLAEDAAQEASAIIYRTIGALKSAGAFRVWAYRIVAREAIRIAKRCAAEPYLKDESLLADIDTKIDVMRALSSLQPDQRAAVVLHYYAGLSSSEIGAVLGVPGATVRFRLSKVRERLAPLLDTHEYDSEATEVC